MTGAAAGAGASASPTDAADRVARLGAALLVAAVILTWLPALGASFQFDDWNVIVRDPRVQSLAAWLAAMPGIRPLLKLSYALNHELGGGVTAFRACNVMVHALNAVLVVALLRAFATRLGIAPSRAVFAALFAATLFALHPVQTEAVTYVSGRSSSLSASFALAAFLAWLHGLGRADEARWRATSLLLFVAALGVKEPAAALPFVMAAWLVASRDTPRLAQRVAPHLLLLAAVVALFVAWPPYRAVLEGSLGARSIATNLLSQVNAIPWLAGQLLRPDLLNADPALAAATTLDGALLLRAAGLLALATTGIVLLRRRPGAGFAITWFFLWLLPTNSLLPRLDVANDRQLYLALVGPAWLLGLGLGALAATPRARAALLLAVAATLAGATLVRNRVYDTEIAFWQDVAQKSPHNARAANNLGYAYALTCRDAEALREFRRAAALDPHDYRAAINLRLLSEDALFAENQRHCAAVPPRAGATAAPP